MENKFEQKLKNGYDEYLKLPKAGRNINSELYNNQWCFLTGMSIISPHPHRHFTFLEFVFHCGKDITLYNRFIKND